MSSPFDHPRSWPATGNSARLKTGLARWKEVSAALPAGPDKDFATHLPRTAGGRAMLACIFGASPFLGAAAVREPGWIRMLWTTGPDEAVRDSLESIRSLPASCDEATARRAIRVSRRRILLAAALADIAGEWSLESVTGALTDFADASCSLALRVLLTRLAARGAVTLAHPDDPERESGLFVLGLGKLGGRELNFSSDIDLILLYDPDRVQVRRLYEAPQHFMRLGRWLISLLAEPTADGPAFRVDLRLRPDPASTPLVLSTPAALKYYRTRGQTWERAAMIKARPIAGDKKAGRRYLDRLGEFVWSRGLDFATVHDLYDIKNRIDEKHRSARPGLPGRNVKLGQGGIREIEFFAQAHQLAFAGSDPSLRVIPTCEALRALVRAGRIPPAAERTLAGSYRYLRSVEHRLQMVADKQTHTLPRDREEFETVSRFLGYPDGGAFGSDLTRRMADVADHFDSFFALPQEFADAASHSALEDQNRDRNRGHLAQLGFKDPAGALRVTERWRDGTALAEKGERARSLLQALTPSLLIAAAGTDRPDVAVRRLDAIVRATTDAVASLSLLQANLHVIETLAETLVASPAMAAMLAARSSLLESLFDPQTDSWALRTSELREDLAEWMQQVGGEDRWERLRDWADTARFRVGVKVIFRSLDPLDAPEHFSEIATLATAEAFRIAEGEVEQSHGRVPGAQRVILATGRFASQSMGIGTPLSLSAGYLARESTNPHRSGSTPEEEHLALILNRMVEGLGTERSGQLQGYSPVYADGPWRLEDLPGALQAASAGLGGDLPGRIVACSGAAAEEMTARLLAARPTALSRSQLRATVGRLQAGARAADMGDDSIDLEFRRGGLAEIRLLLQCLPEPEGNGLPTSGGGMPAEPAAGRFPSEEDRRELLQSRETLTRLRTLLELLGVSRLESVPERLRPLFASAAGARSYDEVAAAIEAITGGVARLTDSVLGAAG